MIYKKYSNQWIFILTEPFLVCVIFDRRMWTLGESEGCIEYVWLLAAALVGVPFPHGQSGSGGATRFKSAPASTRSFTHSRRSLWAARRDVSVRLFFESLTLWRPPSQIKFLFSDCKSASQICLWDNPNHDETLRRSENLKTIDSDFVRKLHGLQLSGRRGKAGYRR